MPIKIDELLPHARPMILIDHVVEFKEDYIHTTLKLKPNAPFMSEGEVPSYISLEYMAQTIGAWNGLRAIQSQSKPKIGFLLGTRELKLACASFKEGDDLDIFGEVKYIDEELASFECYVKKNENVVATATLNVFQPKEVHLMEKVDG